MMKTAMVVCLSLLSLSCASNGAQAPRVMFDDFTYENVDVLAKNGWILRTEVGWPGVPGATWGKERFSLHDDPSQPGNKVLRMTSSTDGTSANTRQSQLCHQRKYLDGTYATRVRFTDQPVKGPDGDQIVETFYLISPLKVPMDPAYSELDFEYLPNGGWGHNVATMFLNTWETFHPEPDWKMDSQLSTKAGSLEGWHTLVLQLTGDNARHFIDGDLIAEHGGKYYPEVPMAVSFNLWFVRDGLLKTADVRQYVEDIDWAFHQVGAVFSPADVDAKVADFRRRSVKFTDTVPAAVPPLPSPCNL